MRLQDKKVNSYSLWAWIFAGVSAPIAHHAGQSSWLATLIAGLLCSIACAIVVAVADRRSCRGGWYSAVQTLWIALVTGLLARWSVSSWPTAAGFPVVGLTLLVLAAFAAWDGATRASHCCSALFWLLALLYAVILVAGTQNLKLQYMMPTAQPFSLMQVVVFLLPALAGFLPCSKRLKVLPLAGVVIFATVLTLWTVGTLSMPVTTQLEEPFYQFSRSLSFSGVSERFESILSVAMTMGYFALFAFLLSAVYHLTERAVPGKGRGGVIVAAVLAATIMVFIEKMEEWVLVVGCVVLWILLPLVVGKKIENDEISD